MKFILTFLLCAVGAISTHGAIAADAADAPVKRSATVKRSMAEKGSFHKMHARKAKTDCEDCHADAPLADNVLLVNKGRPPAKGSPGPVDPKECYDCHRLKSNPPPLYVPH